MARSSHPCAALLVLTAGVVAPHAAWAQNAGNAAAAEALFDQGKAAMAAKDYAQACPKFFESNRLDQGIGTSLWLAECYERNGQTASAWAEFREAAGLAMRSGDAREKVARDRARALEGKLARLTLSVPQDARVPELEVLRDGSPVGPAVWGTAVPTDPGSHTIVARAPGHKPQTLSVTVAPGASEQTLAIPPLEPLPPPPAAPAPAPPASPATVVSGLPWQRVVALASGGLGVVGVGVGSYFGLHAKSQLDASNANGHCGSHNLCDPVGMGDRSSAQSAATASTVLFIAGGVALAGAGVLWFTAPSGEVATPPTGQAHVAPWWTGRAGGVALDLVF